MDDKKHSGALRDFVVEAEEIIEGLNQNLLTMETAPDRSVVKPETINAIFRGAHTLKGMAGMVGLAQVSELSHRLEDLFDKVRMGRQKLDNPLMDVLFEGVEILRKLVELASTGGKESVDTSSLITKIQELTVEKKVDHEGLLLEKAGIDPEILGVLTEYETHRLVENIRAGVHLYEILAFLKLESFDRELTDLNTRLQSIGETITNLPNSGFAPNEGIQFKLIVGSRCDHAKLSQHLAGAKVRISELGNAPPSFVESQEQGAHGQPSGLTGSDGTGLKRGETLEEPSASLKSLTQTIRVDIKKLDILLNLVGELVLTKAIVHQISKELVGERGFTGIAAELQKIAQVLDRRVTDLQEGLIEVRMIPIGQVFHRLVRAIRKISKELGKEINLQISGEETQLDKLMVEELADPLMHMIRNSIDHGIEPREERRKVGKPEIGLIRLSAMQKGNNVVIEVADDGEGIDLARIYQVALKKGLAVENKEYSERDLLNLLFLPGFSTKEEVTEISGRGVGLDVVAKNIAKLNGMLDMETQPGRGTRFSITLPITLVIIKALIVTVGSETYAIPLNAVSESLMVTRSEIKTVERREVIYLRDHTLSLLRLEEVFQLSREGPKPDKVYVIVVGIAEKRVGLVVDAIVGQQEIVIKTVGEFLKGVPGVAGATELGSRKTILVLDVGTLIEEATKGRSRQADTLI